MRNDRPHILAVNPWIHDFAAYDFWARPLGLLGLLAICRDHGFRVSYADCLDRFHPRTAPVDPGRRNGRGPYLKQPLPPPAGLADVPRRYSRYGIPPAWLHADLTASPRPDLVLVTSMMTYWAPGVRETIAAVRRALPGVPVLLGGIYATLCAGHAAAAGADEVVSGPAEASILDIAARYTGHRPAPRFDPGDLDDLPRPAWDLQSQIPYVPLLTTRGCPYRCAYCAAGRLNPGFSRRTPASVAAEIAHWHRRHGVRDFVFYDDALLTAPEHHAIPLLETIAAAGMPVRFHTPNALHIREIDGRMAGLMKGAGFETIRLGLETTAFGERGDLDEKVTETEFLRALGHLRRAGFRGDQVGAYLLAGLPGQGEAALERSVRAVRAAGVTPIPAYYSPIPHTRLWETAKKAARYDLEADPVFTNNAVFPCRSACPTLDDLRRLKQLGRGDDRPEGWP